MSAVNDVRVTSCSGDFGQNRAERELSRARASPLGGETGSRFDVRGSRGRPPEIAVFEENSPRTHQKTAFPIFSKLSDRIPKEK